MSDERDYILDSDVLISAKNRYYAFSICPGFWDSLLHWNAQGRIHTIDRVKQELLNGSPDDEIVQWVGNSVPNEFFYTCADASVVDAFREVMLWAQRHGQYTDAAKAKFASGADGWLVAYSRVNGTTVVTNEQPEPNAKKIIKLPDVCDAFDVRYENTFSMLHQIGVRYHFSENP